MLTTLTSINACTGISILIRGRGIRVSALSVSRNGKKLELDKRLKDKPNLAELIEDLPPKSVIALNVAGKGVLTKVETGATDTNSETIFARVMPGADRADFYLQQFQSGGRIFLSMIRKAEIDPLIMQLSEKGFRVVMLSLGPFPVNQVLGQLNQYGEEVIFDGHELILDANKSWQSYRFQEERKNEFPIKLGVEQIDEQLLLPYAAAFQAILYERIDTVEADTELVGKQMDRFRKTGALKKKGAIVLGAAFFLLFGNFLILSKLTADNGRLQEELSLHATQASDIDAIAGKTAQTEQLVKLMGYSRSVFKAVMIDEVARLMPQEIHLSGVEINPAVVRRTGNQSGQLFTDRRLVITGACASIMPVNEWLARIKSLKWVSRAELRDYGLGSEEDQGPFTIIINY
ncbi:hypothetical protein ACFQZI_14875 [Mucilaginibacter lutimaris]|uniref:Type IV pilus assembly protein PilM n=1 Tax=Mucilaginibacter lutimaris TaxID=931629 RepID=A0ABW2ZIT7_9SPHI